MFHFQDSRNTSAYQYSCKVGFLSQRRVHILQIQLFSPFPKQSLERFVSTFPNEPILFSSLTKLSFLVMPSWCIVRSCKNTSIKGGELSWHSFPSHDKSLMAEWLLRVNRIGQAEGQANKHWKICSEHFEPNLIEKTLAGKRRLKKGAIPTIFDQEDIKRRRQNVQQTREKLLAAEVAFMNGESIPNELVQAISNDQNEDSIEAEKLTGIRRVLQELKEAKKSHESVVEHEQSEPQSDVKVNDTITITVREDEGNSHSVSSIVTEKEQYETKIHNLKLDQRRLKRELNKEKQLRAEMQQQRDRLFQQNAQLQKSLASEQSLKRAFEEELNREAKKRSKIEEELESASFNFKSLSKNTKIMHYYSGFSAEEFEAFIDFLGRDACEYISFDDPGRNLNANERNFIPGRPRGMRPKDQLLMSLCRVRLGFTCQDLAVRFQTSTAQVVRISNAFITLMQRRLQEERLWPDAENVHIHNHQWPESLKPFHQRVRALVENLQSHAKKAKLHQKLSMVAS